MRSLARAFSSSRRAPPMQASKPNSSIASSSVTACAALRESVSRRSTTLPRLIESSTLRTIRVSPSSAARASRKAMTSSKLWPVSMCISGNGKRPGRKAFSARRNSTTESLPPENSSTGFSLSAATSRRMKMASDSSQSRWLRWITADMNIPLKRISDGWRRQSRGAATMPMTRLPACRPHSLESDDSHHQRPARRSSPGRMARVQGSQPMDG